MTHAYRLPDGRILIPITAIGPDTVGDGLMPVPADSPDAREWARWTIDASPDMVKVWQSLGLVT